MWVDPPQELFNDTEIRIRCAAILTTTLMHDYAAHERHMHGIVETWQRPLDGGSLDDARATCAEAMRQCEGTNDISGDTYVKVIHDVYRTETAQTIDPIGLDDLPATVQQLKHTLLKFATNGRIGGAELRDGIDTMRAHVRAHVARSVQAQEHESRYDPHDLPGATQDVDTLDNKTTWWRIVATNVNGRCRVVKRIPTNDDNAAIEADEDDVGDIGAEEDADVNDDTLQVKADGALEAILGMLTNDRGDIAAVWANETHLKDETADRLISFMERTYPAIGMLVSVRHADDAYAGLVLFYRKTVLTPLPSLQRPYGELGADSDESDNEDADQQAWPAARVTPKARQENDKCIRHVWHGRLADVRVKWLEDDSECILTGVYVPQPGRPHDVARWFAMAKRDWQVFAESRIIQGDFNSTPRAALPGGRSKSHLKLSNELLHQLMTKREVECVGDLTRPTHFQKSTTGTTTSTIDLNLAGSNVIARTRASELVAKTSGVESFHKSIAIYYRVLFKTEYEIRDATPAAVFRIGTSLHEQHQTPPAPTGIDLLQVEARVAIRAATLGLLPTRLQDTHRALNEGGQLEAEQTVSLWWTTPLTEALSVFKTCIIQAANKVVDVSLSDGKGSNC